ncbi:MAG: hypothetical protein NVSMB22_18860 [Chloroflexota bacterium]
MRSDELQDTWMCAAIENILVPLRPPGRNAHPPFAHRKDIGVGIQDPKLLEEARQALARLRDYPDDSWRLSDEAVAHLLVWFDERLATLERGEAHDALSPDRA